MNVLIVVPYFAPAWAYGGPPRVTYDFARALAGRGHQVRVLTTDAYERDRRISVGTDNFDGVEVRYLRNLSNRLAWDQKIFLPLGFPAAFQREVGWADVVICSDFRTLQNAVALPMLAASQTPFVLAAFGSLPLTADWKNLPKRAFDVLAGRRLLDGAGSLLAQSAQEAAEYQWHGATAPIDVLPLALDLAELEALPPRGELRRELGIADSERIVLFLGRLHEFKGLGVLAEAFASVAKQDLSSRLVVVGRDDGYQTTLERRIHELGIDGRVVLAGARFGRDRLMAYVDADLFVLPATHQEETPLAGLEAMACGCPVIVSHQALIPGLVEAGAGWAVEASPQAVAAALLNALADESRRRDAGRAAARLIRDRFSLESRAVELEQVLERVVAKAGPRHQPEATANLADTRQASCLPVIASGAPAERGTLRCLALHRWWWLTPRSTRGRGTGAAHAGPAPSTSSGPALSTAEGLGLTAEAACQPGTIANRSRFPCATRPGQARPSAATTHSPLDSSWSADSGRRPGAGGPQPVPRATGLDRPYGHLYGRLSPTALRAVLGPLPGPLVGLARAYLRCFGFPDVAGQVRFPAIVKLLRPQAGERILDAGSGKGIYSNSFGALLRAKPIGVELHPDRLREARRVAQDLQSGASFVEANLERLAFADASLDRAIGVEVLEHVPDDEAAVAEFARVLRPGGTLVVSVPAPDGPPSGDEAERDRARPAWVYHARDGYAPAELEALLERHGFRLVERRSDWGPIFNRLVRLQCVLYQSSPFLLNVLASPLLMLLRPVDAWLARREVTGHGWIYLARRGGDNP